MFAPAHHAAMKHVIPVRRELAVRTIFNFLGPLTNPAGATRQLLGVSDRRYQETIAEALAGLDCEHALVVTADDGLDEISIAGPTRVIEVRDGGTSEWFAEPAELGIAEASAGDDRRRRAGGERGDRAGRPRRRAQPGRRHRDAQRRGRDLRRRRAPTTSPPASTPHGEAIDSGAAAAVLRELVAMRGAGQDG